MAFATADDLAAWLQGAVPGGTDSADLALEVASEAVAQAVGTPIVAGVDTDAVLDRPGGTDLLLPKFPATDVAELTIDGTDPESWDWSAKGILSRTGGCQWPAGNRVVTVTYSHGYAAEDIPLAVKHVTLAVAARLVANPQRLQSFAGGAVFGVGDNVLVTELTGDERDRVIRAVG